MTTLHAYPRPQLRRKEWLSLNGPWDFAFDPDASVAGPEEVSWAGSITVPFSPETVASGLGDRSFYSACWYRRLVEVARVRPGERVLLHFGAVDHEAAVYVNGALAVRHRGGYTPFSVDITRLLDDAAVQQEIVVRAFDDPHDLAKPRGKQDWQEAPHGIWYPRTTGIWQTVWIERLGPNAIQHLRWTSNLERWEIALDARVDGPRRDDLRLRVRLRFVDNVLADDTYSVVSGEVHRRLALSDPGIDDYRNELLWSPSCPTLIQADLELLDGENDVLDSAASYTAMRQVGVTGGHFMLNGRPYPLRMVLDQGYWPQSGMTAPDDDAIRNDVLLTKAMGFNGARKHQKIEDPRYLYWADLEGLLVWEEMPSAYRFTKEAVSQLTAEWQAAIERDRSHPCIVAWVPFNESWGVPDLPTMAAHRHYVQALYHLTRSLDADRPVIGNDGWESLATDIVGIHDYEEDAARLRSRYASVDDLPLLFRSVRPGGRTLALDGHEHAGQPVMVTEYGGVALTAAEPDAWGYSRAESPQDLAERYARLTAALRDSQLLAGFCYTQLTDTYQEANGLLYADRSPKFPLAEIAAATRGPRTPREEEIERKQTERWRELSRSRSESS